MSLLRKGGLALIHKGGLWESTITKTDHHIFEFGVIEREWASELAGMETEEKGLHQRMKEIDADNVALTE